MIILVLTAFGLIAWLQISWLAGQREKKDIVLYCIFLFIGFSLMMLYTLGVKIPNPVRGIRGLLDILKIHY